MGIQTMGNNHSNTQKQIGKSLYSLRDSIASIFNPEESDEPIKHYTEVEFRRKFRESVKEATTKASIKEETTNPEFDSNYTKLELGEFRGQVIIHKYDKDDIRSCIPELKQLGMLKLLNGELMTPNGMKYAVCPGDVSIVDEVLKIDGNVELQFKSSLYSLQFKDKKQRDDFCDLVENFASK